MTRHITNYIANAVKKNKKNARVKTDNIRNHIWVFVNARIDNPEFDSLKETLTLPISEDIMNVEIGMYMSNLLMD